MFEFLRKDALILAEGEVIKEPKKVDQFVSDFSSKNGSNYTFDRKFSIDVNANLSYEIGELKADESSFSVMYLKNMPNAKIELLVIYESQETESPISDIDQRRAEWMELCNAKKVGELVKNLYTSDAYYYNRGRLLSGTKAISSEYGYMNSPSYTLKLSPKHIEVISSDIVFEIGRCSGSYPLPYMLLWQKQNDGTWQILMDSNY